LFNSGRVGFKQVPKFQFSNVLNLLNRTGKAYTHKDGYPEFLNGLKYPAVQSKFNFKRFFFAKNINKIYVHHFNSVISGLNLIE